MSTLNPPSRQNHTSRTRPPRHKAIRKTKARGEKVPSKRSGDGYTSALPKEIMRGSALGTAVTPKVASTARSWLQLVDDGYLCEGREAQACIDKQLNDLPLLGSIEQLFSLSSSKRLTADSDLGGFYRYCRVVSFVGHGHSSSMLLKGEQASGVGHLAIDRHNSPLLSSLLPLSLSELQTLQKRGSFMEKLQENESKYDASITRMSDISKQLAFNYRVYLQKRSQLVEMLRQMAEQIPLQREYEDECEEYARMLLRKNVTHAFRRSKLEPLNYFKFKEHSEGNRPEPFSHLRSPDELRIFIEKRKPKRGRKLLLATACSVCLSDYHQMSNPFHSCPICGLRAHALCYSFERSRCGYCAYQKVERQVKEESSWCFICRRPGLMTIKMHGGEFAHAFCLLIHGYWRLGGPDVPRGDQGWGKEGIGSNSSAPFLQTRFRNNCAFIEFLNPKQNCTASSLPAIDSTLYASSPVPCEGMELENDSSLGEIGVIGVMREREEIELWENDQQFKKIACACCQQSVYGGCYLSCTTCRQTYHGLCAFFSGFDLQISDHAWQANSENSVSLNCCVQGCEQTAWSRKYKLNYQRIAFNVQDTVLQLQPSPSQDDNKGLLFNY